MRSLLTMLGCVWSVVALSADPVLYAVVSDDLTRPVTWTKLDPELVERYGADPTKAAKVAKLRLWVETKAPNAAKGETVEPVGYIVDALTIRQAWQSRKLTDDEVAAANDVALRTVSLQWSRLLEEGQWEDGLLRVDALQCQLMALMAKAIQGANLQTNLTVAERNRFVEIRDSLSAVVALWNAAKTNRAIVLQSTGVVDTAKLIWPTNRITAQ